MVKIKVSADCGNSPKREFLKAFNIAFAEGNIPFLSDSVAEDIAWNMVGDKTIEGKSNFIESLEEMKENLVSELAIDKIVTHGKEGAVNGTLKMENGKTFAFADIYEFRGAKGTQLQSMVSYIIEI